MYSREILASLLTEVNDEAWSPSCPWRPSCTYRENHDEASSRKAKQRKGKNLGFLDIIELLDHSLLRVYPMETSNSVNKFLIPTQVLIKIFCHYSFKKCNKYIYHNSQHTIIFLV